MVSATEHRTYCLGPCGLIHVEQVYDENLFAPRSRVARERGDEPKVSLRNRMSLERAMPIWGLSVTSTWNKQTV